MVSLVYMVAGLSSRFGGKIKQFAQVGPNNETLIEVSLNQALQSPFKNIVFVVGDKTEQPFKEKFGNEYKGVPIKYVKQSFDPAVRDKPWGTCDAVVTAKDAVDNYFVVCNGDDLYGPNSFAFLYNWTEWNSNPVTLGYKLDTVLPKEGSVNRGIFKINENSIVKEIKEMLGIERSNLLLDLNTPVSMNIFCLTKTEMDLLETQLIKFKDTHKEDRKIECYLPVELSNLIIENKIKMTLLDAPDKWIGITNPEDESIVRDFITRWYT